MGDIGKYLNIALIVYFVILLLFSILFGSKRKLYKSLVRLGTVLICLPVSYFLCKLIANNALDGIVDSLLKDKFVESEMSVETMSEIFSLAKAFCIPFLFILYSYPSSAILLFLQSHTTGQYKEFQYPLHSLGLLFASQ